MRSPPATLPELFAAQAARTPGRRRGGVRGRAAELRASSMRAPTGWRIICAGSASGPRWWSGSASSARPRWWSGCSASSRPAAPICRWTRTIRASGWPSCWRRRRRWCWSPRRPRCAERLPAPHARRRRARSMPMRAAIAAPARTAPPSARPATPRLRHLHLRLHRNPKGVVVTHGGVANLVVGA